MQNSIIASALTKFMSITDLCVYKTASKEIVFRGCPSYSTTNFKR